MAANEQAMNLKRTYYVAILLLAISVSVRAQNEQVRVAVVLGHYPTDTYTPTEQQTARCLKVFEMYSSGKINRIVVSGGFTRGHISEARMMKIALVAFGVSEENVIEEERSSTTIENSFFVAKLFSEQDWKLRAVLVSQSYHLARAEVIFRDSGFEVKKVNAKNGVGKEDYEILDNPALEFITDNSDGNIVLFESFQSNDPQVFSKPEQAARLRAAAAAYRNGGIKKITILTDWYTRSPVDLAEMMHVALVSLGVSSADIVMKNNVHYSGLDTLGKMVKENAFLVLTSPDVKSRLAETYPEMKVVSFP